MATRNVVYVDSITYVGKHPRLGTTITLPRYLVIKHGYSNFENDDDFSVGDNVMIQSKFKFSPDIRRQDWYYNTSSGTFQTTAP